MLLKKKPSISIVSYLFFCFYFVAPLKKIINTDEMLNMFPNICSDPSLECELRSKQNCLSSSAIALNWLAPRASQSLFYLPGPTQSLILIFSSFHLQISSPLLIITLIQLGKILFYFINCNL